MDSFSGLLNEKPTQTIDIVAKQLLSRRKVKSAAPSRFKSPAQAQQAMRLEEQTLKTKGEYYMFYMSEAQKAIDLMIQTQQANKLDVGLDRDPSPPPSQDLVAGTSKEREIDGEKTISQDTNHIEGVPVRNRCQSSYTRTTAVSRHLIQRRRIPVEQYTRIQRRGGQGPYTDSQTKSFKFPN